MVQSIVGISSGSAISSINGTEKLDNSEIKAVFESTLNQASASQGTPSASSKSSDSEDLIQEFKNVTKGITVCKTCGSIYLGTAVVDCSKCGNNVNDDKKKTSEAQDTKQVASTEASKETGASIQTVGTLPDSALVKTP